MRSQMEKTGIITLGLAAMAFDKAKEAGTKLAHTAEDMYNDREKLYEDLTMQMRNWRDDMNNRMTDEMQKLKDKWHFGKAEA